VLVLSEPPQPANDRAATSATTSQKPALLMVSLPL
jgi:hypothetical protein